MSSIKNMPLRKRSLYARASRSVRDLAFHRKGSSMPTCLKHVFTGAFSEAQNCMLHAFYRISHSPSAASVEDFFSVTAALLIVVLMTTTGLFKTVLK